MKKKEGFIYHKLLDKRKRKSPKFQVNDLLRVAVLRKPFSKGDKTNWSYKLYKTRETIIDTIPTYRIDNLPEPYNEGLLKKANLTMKENKDTMKKLNLN